MSNPETPILLRSWTVVELGRLRRRLTIMESEKPETIVLSFFDPGMDDHDRRAQSIELSRAQWEALAAIGGKYDHNFNWVSQPSQGSLELPFTPQVIPTNYAEEIYKDLLPRPDRCVQPGPAPIIPANYAMAEEDI